MAYLQTIQLRTTTGIQPVDNIQHRQRQPVLFGNQAPDAKEQRPMTQSELDKAAARFRRALLQAEGMPGSDTLASPFDELIRQLLGGSALSLGRKIQGSINRQLAGTKETRSCKMEQYTNEVGAPRIGYRVTSGAFTKLFEKRALASADFGQNFEQFVAEQFGKTPRVIIAMTGWTKPPVDPLLKNEVYRRQMEAMPKEQWPKFAEQVYVDLIQKFIEKVLIELKKELPDFNPVTDLGMIYGVTPEGVDRGILESCKTHGIPLVGLTCYDWAEYIPDQHGLPPVYLADDPAQFGTLMADTSNKVVVTGGRSFAANVKLNGDQAKGAERRIAVDLFKSFADVEIPPIVPGDDEVTTKVVNAAALSMALGDDPWNYEVVQRAINGRQTDNRAVFVTTHILKQQLENLYHIRKLCLTTDCQC